jgi:putative transposase
MPRRQRITQAGLFHIINRGVERRTVFIDSTCYDKFISLLSDANLLFETKIHAFCLMSNHYHILIETSMDNLSDVLRYINLSYTKWFNATYDRVGHLWQGRYLSYYICDETHFWTVAKYIERNPIAAQVVTNIETYTYQSLYMRIHPNHPHSSVVQNSKILDMTIVDYKEFISTPLSSELSKKVYEVARPNKDANGKIYLEKPISSFFEGDGDRNEKIKNAYSYGYTKTAIAEYSGLSRVTITKVLQ